MTSETQPAIYSVAGHNFSLWAAAGKEPVASELEQHLQGFEIEAEVPADQIVIGVPPRRTRQRVGAIWCGTAALGTNRTVHGHPIWLDPSTLGVLVRHRLVGRSAQTYGALLLKRFLLDYYLVASLARHRGVRVVHGSAVSDGRRAYVFVGADGAGKTTAARQAAELLGSHWNVVADNYVPMTESRCWAFPGLPRTGFEGPLPTYQSRPVGQSASLNELELVRVLVLGGATPHEIINDETHLPYGTSEFNAFVRAMGVDGIATPGAVLVPDALMVRYDYRTDSLERSLTL